MENNLLGKLKSNKIIALIIVATTILSGIAAFTDTVTKLIDKYELWFGEEKVLVEPEQQVIVTQVEDSSSVSNTPDYAEENDPVELQTQDNAVIRTLTTSVGDKILKDFEAYSSKHVSISDASDNITLNRDGLVIDVNVGTHGLEPYTEHGDTRYFINKRSNLYEINPSNPYLIKLAEGIIPEYLFSNAGYRMPMIDLKVVNNSDKSVYISQAIFRFKKSVSDNCPYLLMEPSDPSFILPLSNIGGVATEVTLKFPITDSTGIAKMHEIKVNEISENNSCCDFHEIFKSYNVDTEFFDIPYHPRKMPSEELQKAARGSFLNPIVPINGTIKYNGQNANKQNQEYTYKFYWEVDLIAKPGSLLGFMPYSAKYDLKLELDKDNYTKTVSISQAIAKSELDRFGVRLMADQNSRHLFDMTLIYNNNQELTLSNIALNYFRPKTAHFSTEPVSTPEQ